MKNIYKVKYYSERFNRGYGYWYIVASDEIEAIHLLCRYNDIDIQHLRISASKFTKLTKEQIKSYYFHWEGETTRLDKLKKKSQVLHGVVNKQSVFKFK